MTDKELKDWTDKDVAANKAFVEALAPQRYISSGEIDALFSYHPPKSEVEVRAHEHVRALVRSLAHDLNSILAESPQKTYLLRQVLPGVMMRANQVIAVHGIRDDYVFEVEDEGGTSTQ